MDERIAKYEEKMTKTLANLESEFGTIRAGKSEPSRTGPYYGRLLRSADASAAGGKYFRTGGKNDPDPAMGSFSGKGD